MTGDNNRAIPETDIKVPQINATTEYCAKLQQWMWQYYWWNANWQSWVALSASPIPAPNTNGQATAAPASSLGSGQQPATVDSTNRYSYPFGPTASSHPHPSGAQMEQMGVGSAQQQNGSPSQAGREYTIPSPLQRGLAETVDVFILFCVKTTILLWIMHLRGMNDITKFFSLFIILEKDVNMSTNDLQKVIIVTLVYRLLSCVYETICIWGACGATPGKFLLGLQVVTCDRFARVRPNRVLVVPATDVSLSASTMRTLNKGFTLAFFFPVFITLFFFNHNRTVYDIMAGTIVVQCRGNR